MKAQLPVEEAMEDADEDLLAGDENSGDNGRKKREQENAWLLSDAIVKAHKNLPSAAKADSHD
jgi:hypothetical protein